MSQRAARVCAWIWILAIHFLLLWVDHRPEPRLPLGDEGTYWRVAERIAAGDPAELPLLWPALYPAFVAGCITAARWLGLQPLWIVQVIQLAVLFGVAAIARDLCRRLVGGESGQQIGEWTALGIVGFPPMVAFAHYARPEILHLGFFAVALWILGAKSRSKWGAIGLGAVCGLALQTKSLMLPFVPVLFAPLAIDGRSRERALRVAIATGALAITLAPTWLLQSHRGGTVGLTGSSWFNIWVGLNDHSRRNLRQPVVAREFAIFEASGDSFEQRNQILREKIAGRIRERGVGTIVRDQFSRQYFRLFDADSYLTDQLPGGIVSQRGGGYQHTPQWIAGVLRSISFTLYAGTLVGFAFGIAICPPAGRRWMWIGLAFIGYNLLLFFVLHAKSRFRVQFLPFVFFYAACAFDQWSRPMSPADPPVPVWRWLVGAAIALTTLGLAFGAPWIDG